MKVKGQHYQTIWLDEKDPRQVKFINQNYLPFRLVVEKLKTSEEVYHAILDMKLRGAPLIGAAAAFGVYLAVLESAGKPDPDKYIIESTMMISASRPTAVNLSAAIERQLQAISRVQTTEEKIAVTLSNFNTILEEEKQSCYQIGQHGLTLIEKLAEQSKGKPVNILTHCNAGWLACIDYGTATAPIYLAHEKGIPVHVWVDETRPRNQGGRLTAWELKQQGVSHTVIVDNAGGHLMQRGQVDLVLVGSDRTTRTGDVANKIGTYLKALAARDNDVPFFVALPSSSIDFNLEDGIREIPIEERDEEEIRYVKWRFEKVPLINENSPVLNIGFDVTPARLVTGLITERGICEANKNGIKSLFPEKYKK
ncbi:MAG: S-methyl-5-thioribose-1-phosphate isomerase [Bacteroidales bacterium]|nr:S-methyl-5-thioribose-1-phosphate isomerase [Bacteroidales bacterium]